MERESPNDGFTPYYNGEQLVFIPLLLFYLGKEAIESYLRENSDGTMEITTENS